MTRATRLAAVALATAATALTAAPAHAESTTYRDAAHDVAVYDGSTGTVDPDVKNGDVRRVTVSHTRTQVVLKASFTSLAKNVDSLGQYVEIRTPDGRNQVVVQAGDGNWDGALGFSGSGDTACRDAEHTLNYRRDTFKLTVPRSCLGSPRWVRVGFGTTTSQGSENRADDSRLDGEIRGELALTPRLSRG